MSSGHSVFAFRPRFLPSRALLCRLLEVSQWAPGQIPGHGFLPSPHCWANADSPESEGNPATLPDHSKHHRRLPQPTMSSALRINSKFQPRFFLQSPSVCLGSPKRSHAQEATGGQGQSQPPCHPQAGAGITEHDAPQLAAKHFYFHLTPVGHPSWNVIFSKAFIITWRTGQTEAVVPG